MSIDKDKFTDLCECEGFVELRNDLVDFTDARSVGMEDIDVAFGSMTFAMSVVFKLAPSSESATKIIIELLSIHLNEKGES
jgi:hypothetical protein